MPMPRLDRHATASVLPGQSFRQLPATKRSADGVSLTQRRLSNSRSPAADGFLPAAPRPRRKPRRRPSTARASRSEADAGRSGTPSHRFAAYRRAVKAVTAHRPSVLSGDAGDRSVFRRGTGRAHSSLCAPQSPRRTDTVGAALSIRAIDPIGRQRPRTSRRRQEKGAPTFRSRAPLWSRRKEPRPATSSPRPAPRSSRPRIPAPPEEAPCRWPAAPSGDREPASGVSWPAR